MKSKAALFWMGMLFLFCGCATWWVAWRSFRTARLDGAAAVYATVDQEAEARDLVPLERFTLTDQQGQEFCSDELVGKVWVCSFFYTSCPSICRMQNNAVAKLQTQYKDRDVHFVSITCDPATDTPAVLADYAKFFNADPQRWHFLTGDFDYIQRIGPMMETVVKEELHSDRLFIVDRQGKKRGGFRSTQSEQFEELTSLVDQLLDEPAELPTDRSLAEVENDVDAGPSGPVDR